MSVLSRLLSRGDADEQLVIEPMRRRHLADILAIEQVVVPEAVDARRVPQRARAGPRQRPLLHRRPRRRATSSATPG